MLSIKLEREREREREMADISILVAEEHERRVKNGRKDDHHHHHHHQQQQQQLKSELASRVSVLAQTLQKKIGHPKMEFFKWAKEPRSQVGLEASNCFFSA
ncbi:hypothetical protein D8674_013242 [Pyrus ussuriensis x Pyrus communis]|uniref:Uncharacterized protein n=1 Tax=Pyrus ussuriensis x Pyrus communis TaxID=2448454 RepID=A0A5N5GRQ5_9ROSA|nr:hypothetical protein D8674_013242 [Pyrus ussuriensis x Pyrus communis]